MISEHGRTVTQGMDIGCDDDNTPRKAVYVIKLGWLQNGVASEIRAIY